MRKERDPSRYPPKLKGKEFKVLGSERLSKTPISLRLYQADDDVLRPKGSEFAEFIREAVREKIIRDNI